VASTSTLALKVTSASLMPVKKEGVEQIDQEY
jgi:hypothetical protein